MESLNRTEVEFLFVVSWFIWKERSNHLHNNKFERSEQTLSKAESFLEVYQAATRNKVSPHVQLPMPSSTAIWSPPGSGLKLNVDATINNQKGQAGLGCIIRNSSGDVMAAASTKRACLGSVEVAEALAILEGIHLAKESGLHLTLIESDSANVVSYI
ncbi:Ribonuclease H-like domain containing protein [Melia azedarach]|uniref:Ribonuclease H-like domain containing protein n=1 Tax=Melia azedarach TaxID=155640 RepID=A0ACC1X871_MELAZ|nr:Ribonuclease H-like domain containing protein [Melia azedarach]